MGIKRLTELLSYSPKKEPTVPYSRRDIDSFYNTKRFINMALISY